MGSPTSIEGAAIVSTDRGGISAATPLPVARWIGLIALLLAEGLVLSELFDSTPFLADHRWWATLLANGPRQVGRLIIATVVVLPLIGGRRLREAFDRASGEERRRPAGRRLLVHLAAFAVFAALTVVIARGGLRGAAYPGGWVLAWITSGATTLGTWVAAVLPVGFMRASGRRGVARLLVALAVAVIAVGVGQAFEQVFWSAAEGSPLVRVTFWAVSGLIGLFTSDPVCRPESAELGTRDFFVSVAPQCSGYEGMGLILVFLGAYLALYRRTYRFPRALLLLPLGIAAMWLANVARIALLVAVGVWISPQVAVQGFHSQAGWLAFNGISLGLVLASRRIRLFTQTDPRDEEAESVNPTAAYLVPLLVIIATTMITGAFTDRFDRFYPLRVLTGAATLCYFRRHSAAMRWTWSWTAVAIGLVTFVLWVALEPAPIGTTTESALVMGLGRLGPVWGTVWLVSRVVGSVVIVPMAEELAFRGYLTRRLIATEFQSVPLGRFTWLSFLLSSVLFGALHGRWLAGILAGMLFAIALYRRGKLADAVMAHATTNALIAGSVVTTGDWSLWE
jgi:exosortase E/protease (VPEID-CTERM system)